MQTILCICFVGGASAGIGKNWIGFTTHGYDLFCGTIMAKEPFKAGTFDTVENILHFWAYDKEKNVIGEELGSVRISFDEPTYFEIDIEGAQDVIIATRAFCPGYIVLGDTKLMNIP